MSTETVPEDVNGGRLSYLVHCCTLILHFQYHKLLTRTPVRHLTFVLQTDIVLVCPWKEWKVEDNFLQNLNKWNRDHQDQTLRKVLEKVNTVLESSVFEAALKFIPDNPFPAATLVESLFNLVLLGTVSNTNNAC